MPNRIESVRATLRDRGATLPCPACGHDAWEGSGEFGLIIGVEVAQATPGEITPSGGGLEAVMDVCLNCGFLRQHMVFVLERDQG